MTRIVINSPADLEAIRQYQTIDELLDRALSEVQRLCDEDCKLRRELRRTRRAFLRASGIAGILALVALWGWLR